MKPDDQPIAGVAVRSLRNPYPESEVGVTTQRVAWDRGFAAGAADTDELLAECLDLLDSATGQSHDPGLRYLWGQRRRRVTDRIRGHFETLRISGAGEAERSPSTPAVGLPETRNE